MPAPKTLSLALLLAILLPAVAFSQKTTKKTTKPTPKTKSKSAVSATALGEGDTRTKAEVEALIDKEGRTPPEWFESTPLNYPKTLDLSWPEKPNGGWNNQVNVGQFIWDVINPNENRWREGIRLLHHLLTMHSKDPEKREKIMLTIARLYQNLLEDYARAAFWYRKVGADDPVEFANSAIDLAECYWKLGSRSMALNLLNGINPPRLGMVKLLADMGETDRALEIARSYFNDKNPEDAYLNAADACRLAGRYPEAIQYYEKILELVKGVDNGRTNRFRGRAQASLDAIKLFELSDVKKVPDGTYRDSSLGYEAQIQVEVIVKDQRIDKVRVTQHREKQYYSSISDTTRKIVEKQSVKGVDATSNATITSEAIINATAKALAAAAK